MPQPIKDCDSVIDEIVEKFSVFLGLEVHNKGNLKQLLFKNSKENVGELNNLFNNVMGELEPNKNNIIVLWSGFASSTSEELINQTVAFLLLLHIVNDDDAKRPLYLARIFPFFNEMETLYKLCGNNEEYNLNYIWIFLSSKFAELFDTKQAATIKLFIGPGMIKTKDKDTHKIIEELIIWLTGTIMHNTEIPSLI